MNRRAFLGRAAALGGASALSRIGLAVPATAAVAGRLIITDAHAHPMRLFGIRQSDRTTPTLETLHDAGVALCAFAAIGDSTYRPGRFGAPFADTLGQLERVTELEAGGQLVLVRAAADLPDLATRKTRHGLLAIEGGDALEGQLRNLDRFFACGVRQIALIHDRDNELGFNQRSHADGPLTPFGVAVVEKMNALGMVVDVAHARKESLRSIAAATTRPLVDSHTSPFLPGDEATGPRRLRTWQEMEWVAKTGGVVCTWPFAYIGAHGERTTFAHWAAEIALMKSRLGIEHCGLGTDGGGGLPRLIDGWDSIASLPQLIDALRIVGLSPEEIAAFVGGNYLRVLGACLAAS